MNKTLLTAAILSASLPLSLSALTIENATPGQLTEAIGTDTDATTLTVAGGAVNAADFAFILDKMPQLQSIDLSGCTIAPYSGMAIAMTRVKKAEANRIPPYAFTGMSNLTTVKLPATVTTIGAGAFSGTAITEMTLPASVDSIADYAFMRCTALKSVSLPASLRALGKKAFANCPALSTIRFASGTSLTALPEQTFEGCVALTDINLNALTQCTEIGPWSLAHCHGLTALSLPSAVTDIAQGALLADEQIAKFNLPASTARVGDHALAGMSAVTSTTLPSTLLYLGTGAMAGWDALTEINAQALNRVPDLGDDVWHDINASGVTLEVTEGMAQAFAAADQWCEFNIHENSETGIGQLPATADTQAMTVSTAPDRLTVSATGDLPLGSVAVFSTTGLRVAYATGITAEATFSTSGWTHGVYLIVSNLGVAKITL